MNSNINIIIIAVLPNRNNDINIAIKIRFKKLNTKLKNELILLFIERSTVNNKAVINGTEDIIIKVR